MQKHLKKKFFLNNSGLLFNATENVLDSFKSKLIPIKKLDKTSTREPPPEKVVEQAAEATTKVATKLTPKPATEETPTEHNKSKLKFRQELMNETISELTRKI